VAKPVVRLRAVQLAFALGIGIVLARAAQVQLLMGAQHAATARAQRTEQVELPAPRGTIYDRNGIVLAQTIEVFNVGVAANELVNLERDAEAIASQLGLSRRVVLRQLRQRYAYFGGGFTSEQVQALRVVQGVHLTGELQRFYPDPGLARTILGRPAADGRRAGGVESVLDTLLAGTPGSGVVIRDRQGRRYESPGRLGSLPNPGLDVYLTIDAALQEIVEDALDDAIAEYAAESGDVVVLDPQTGEILAVASHTVDGSSTASAFNSVFEPGSTAKVFAAAALLVEEKASLDDSIWTENGTYVTAHRTITDVHPNGWLTLQQIIEQSSNIGIVKFARRLSPEAQYSMLRGFGLGTPTAVEFPSEASGVLKPPKDWSGITGESMAMGYELNVTPLQLAQAYAGIANDGLLMRPTLIKRVEHAGGATVYEHEPAPVRRAVLPEAATQLRTALRGVVYPGGTGETAAMRGYEVAGKTGTAWRAGPGGYVPNSYTASFTSLFPADRPQLVTVVKLDNPVGHYGGVTAAPVTRAVLQQVLAAETGALDRGLLAGVEAPALPVSSDREPPPRRVFAWPLVPAVTDSGAPHAVPELNGLTLRVAAGRLHKAGLKMQPSGWGVVVTSDPAAGTPVPPGTVVKVVARELGGIPE
jgi:cell division protein FtsI (penicillin-binding protein 3)